MNETLRVGAAFPDPPFNGADNDGGLDISLMHEIAATLGLSVEFIPYTEPNFNGIFDALDAGAYGCDACMKLAPVLTELVRHLPGVEVVQRGLSTERIATAARTSDSDLLARIDAAQADLERDGRLAELRDRWLGSPELDHSGTRQPTGAAVLFTPDGR